MAGRASINDQNLKVVPVNNNQYITIFDAMTNRYARVVMSKVRVGRADIADEIDSYFLNNSVAGSIAEYFATNPVSADVEAYLLANPAPAGVKGDQGLKGDQGVKGDSIKGDKGDQGIQGLKGDQGDQGIQGLKGDKGDQGIQGLKGDSIKGDQGIQGLKGDQGIQGLKGDKGDQGIQGIQGVKGDSIKGDQGIQGIQGVKGDQGIQGIQGVKGDSIKGDQGIQGLKGDQGIQGIQGPGPSNNQLSDVVALFFANNPQIKVKDFTAQTGANGQASFAFSPAFTSIITVIVHEGWVGSQMLSGAEIVASRTLSSALVQFMQSRATLLLSSGPFEVAQSGRTVKITVVGT